MADQRIVPAPSSNEPLAFGSTAAVIIAAAPQGGVPADIMAERGAAEAFTLVALPSLAVPLPILLPVRIILREWQVTAFVLLPAARAADPNELLLGGLPKLRLHARECSDG